MSNTSKNAQIQVLRALFCFFIMVYHFSCRYAQIYGNSEYYWKPNEILGNVGLWSFLTISGFFFISPNKEFRFMPFIINKAKRLYPDYLYAIVLIYLFSQGGYMGAEREISLTQFLTNIPLLNIFLGYQFVDGAHWYIVFILFLTIVFAFIQLFNLQKHISFWYIHALGFITFAILYRLSVFSILLSIAHYVKFYLFFTIGILYRMYCSDSIKSKNVILYLGCATITVLLMDNIIMLCSIATAFILLYFAVEKRLSPLEKLTPLIKLGDISYLVYLLHQNIGYSVINFINHNISVSVWISVLFAIIFILFLSVVADGIKRKALTTYECYCKKSKTT